MLSLDVPHEQEAIRPQAFSALELILAPDNYYPRDQSFSSHWYHCVPYSKWIDPCLITHKHVVDLPTYLMYIQLNS